MKSCITTSHLYGIGGGAKAVFAFTKALAMDGPVTVFTRTAVPEIVANEMPSESVLAMHYPGCSAGYDLHLNVDHFRYETPLAKRNVADIFHPHQLNKPPDGFELLANSKFTKDQIMEDWGLESTVVYLPIENDYYVGKKKKIILHVSRFAAPTQYADKGHREMIQAFRSMNLEGWQLAMVGPVDPNQHGYFSSLMAEAAGSDIVFAIDQPRDRLLDWYSMASIYWHMTGVGLPNVSGAQEHLGLTTIEAMASGCVPIVRGTGGQVEVVRGGIDGLHVDSGNLLASVTETIANDLSLWSLIQQQSLRSGKAWVGFYPFFGRFYTALDGADNEVPRNDIDMPEYSRDDVAVIIPVWNSTTVWQCLNSMPDGPEVIVVDNGSDSQVVHPRIDKYVKLDENLGFASANNIGKEKTDKPIILALNDDCFPPEDDDGMWLDIMLHQFNDSGVGVVGAKLVYPDGRLQHAGVSIDFHRPDVAFHRWYGQEDSPAANVLGSVPAVTGACLMARRELYDMRPDLYPQGNYEDIHLCMNAWDNGYRVVYQPAACLVHVEAVTKGRTGIDYVDLNRDAFVNAWRDRFLDHEGMKGARHANRL